MAKRQWLSLYTQLNPVTGLGIEGFLALPALFHVKLSRLMSYYGTYYSDPLSSFPNSTMAMLQWLSLYKGFNPVLCLRLGWFLVLPALFDEKLSRLM